MFTFKPENLMVENQLGQGGFGQVFPYRSKNDPNGEKWVVKVQEVDFGGLRQVMQEIALGFKCQHQNILSIKGFDLRKIQPKTIFENRQKRILEYEVYMKLPRMEQTLQEKLEQQKQLGELIPEPQALKYFYDTACGLFELHKQKIAHKDIKPENILLDKDGIAKIADIGLAKCLELDSETVSRGGCTLSYAAPEITEADKDAKLKKDDILKSDLWSLGITILELCLLKSCIIRSTWSLGKKEEVLTECIKSLKATYSDDLVYLIQNLLDFDPDKRVSLEILIEKLGQLLNPSLQNASNENNGDAVDEMGEHMIISSQTKARRGPGKVRQEEIDDIEGRISLNGLEKAYGDYSSFEAKEKEEKEEKESALIPICRNQSMANEERNEMLQRALEKHLQEIRKKREALAPGDCTVF